MLREVTNQRRTTRSEGALKRAIEGCTGEQSMRGVAFRLPFYSKTQQINCRIAVRHAMHNFARHVDWAYRCFVGQATRHLYLKQRCRGRRSRQNMLGRQSGARWGAPYTMFRIGGGTISAKTGLLQAGAGQAMNMPITVSTTPYMVTTLGYDSAGSTWQAELTRLWASVLMAQVRGFHPCQSARVAASVRPWRLLAQVAGRW